MDSVDRYASAKTTLRENVKWLATGIGGVAALLLAGTPFTGFGALPIPSTRFFGAAISLLVAAACGFKVWKVFLTALRPDATYTRYFIEKTIPGADPNLNAEDKSEYTELKSEFERNKAALLPKEVDTFDTFEEKLDERWAAYMKSPGDTPEKEAWLAYQSNMRDLRDWAAFMRLNFRVQKSLIQTQRWGGALLFSLVLFAWCVNPGSAKDRSAGSGTVVIEQHSLQQVGPDTAADVPKAASLAPVVFDLRKSQLTDEALHLVERARDYLRGSPQSALLLLAHTDTLGSAQFNSRLADERARAIRKVLIEEGSIAANRVFCAVLPATDLAKFTGPQVALAENRTVEFVPITLPAR